MYINFDNYTVSTLALIAILLAFNTFCFNRFLNVLKEQVEIYKTIGNNLKKKRICQFFKYFALFSLVVNGVHLVLLFIKDIIIPSSSLVILNVFIVLSLIFLLGNIIGLIIVGGKK